ncbi:MAG: TCR/Tet family MFS transporter [Chitinophagaceae bacterium]
MRGSKAATGFIFVTLLIDVIGFGIIIPVVPGLIQQLTGASLSDASETGGFLLAVYAIMQFIFAPIIGNLSDQYGRRPVLLLALFGFSIDYLLTAFSPNIYWLFFGRVMAGITGSSFTTASAYIADVSTPENKAQNFGIIGAAFGLGFIIGPVIGGLLGDMGPRIPFFAAAILSLINWLYGYFILPESLSIEHRRKFSWKRANPVSSLLALTRYPKLVGLIAALTLLYIASHAVQSNWTYYTIEKFNWSKSTIGISLGVVGVAVALVQGVLIRKIIPALGKEKSVFAGLAFYCIGFILFGLATQTWMMFAFTLIYCMGGIAMPSIQGIMSDYVPKNEQGELQGALTSLMSLTAIIGPLLMNYAFAYFTSAKAPMHISGAAMFLASFLTLFSSILAYRTLLHKN